MTYAELLRRHEAERARRLAGLVAAVRAQLRPGMRAWEAWLRSARDLAGDNELLFLALAFNRLPALVATSGADAALAAALVELEELGADQADDEAEAVTDERSNVAPVLVGATAGAVIAAAVLGAAGRAERRLRSRPGAGSVVADVRAGIVQAVERTVVTEATKALNTGALAALRTYTGVDAYWRTEAGPCPECAALAGQLVDVATGIPPAHPNCRCTTVPWPAGDRVPATVGAA